MMLRKLIVGVVFAVIAYPSMASAQFAVGVRAGTVGIGVEAGVGLTPQIALRGGFGITKYHYDRDIDDKSFSIDTPPSIWDVGVQLAPFANAFHLSAGVLHRPQFDLAGTYTGATEVGNNTYNGTIKLTGNMKNEREIGPYAGLGFGKMTKRGLGFSLDVGLAQLGEGKITFTSATCTTSSGAACPNQSQFQADVQAEADKATKDAGTYLKWHPILSLSLHYGFAK